jgi:hypothetical protein
MIAVTTIDQRLIPMVGAPEGAVNVLRCLKLVQRTLNKEYYFRYDGGIWRTFI